MAALSEQTVRAINIAVLTFCSLELVILLLTFPRFKLKNRATGYFYAKLLVSAFMVLFYALSFIRKSEAFSVLMQALAYVGIYAVYVLYILYVKEHVNEAGKDKKIPEWVTYLSVGFGAFGALLWILSLFSEPFRELSDPELKYGGMFALAHSGGFVLVLVSVVILVKYRDVLGKRETWVLSSMPILMVAAALAEPFAQGIELRYPSMVLEFLIVYTNHHLELEAKQEIEETVGVRQRLNSAADRMKPHYLYNVLTTIYYLCETDPSKAQHAIGIFSEYMRSTLETIQKDELVDFTWEMKEIRNYLALEKIRFGDKLNIEYDIEYEGFKLPQLTVQPLVENAVKHGIGGKEEGGTVKIVSRRLSDGGAQVSVIDDGIGFDVEGINNQDVTQEGIANLRERLRLEAGADLTITSSIGKGTTAIVTIRPETGL